MRFSFSISFVSKWTHRMARVRQEAVAQTASAILQVSLTSYVSQEISSRELFLYLMEGPQCFGLPASCLQKEVYSS